MPFPWSWNVVSPVAATDRVSQFPSLTPGMYHFDKTTLKDIIPLTDKGAGATLGWRTQQYGNVVWTMWNATSTDGVTFNRDDTASRAFAIRRNADGTIDYLDVPAAVNPITWMVFLKIDVVGSAWRPGVTNTIDSGSPVARWRDLFAGRTIDLDQGTITVDTPAEKSVAIWNAGAVTFVHKDMNVTDTASAVASILERWRVGGVVKAEIRKDGAVGVGGAVGANERLTVVTASGFGARIGTIPNDGTAALFVVPVVTTQSGVLVRGIASQASPLLEIQNNAGTTFLKSLMSVSAVGDAPLSILTNPTSSPAGTNPAIRVVVASAQPSNPSAADFVAIYSHIETATGRTRVWGSNAVAQASAIDGMAMAYEGNVNVNITGDAPDPPSVTQKIGLWLASGGTFRPSAAIALSSTTLANRWKHALWMEHIGGAAGSTLLKLGANVSVDYGFDLQGGTFNIGTIRHPNNRPEIWRNAANTADVRLIYLNASDQVFLSGDGQDIIWGRANVGLGGGAGATLGTVGGTGPVGAAQTEWIRVLNTAGAVRFMPVWT